MAIYYVRPNGSNINAGTGYLASQAWATITKAAQTMVAGDICYVAPGVYKETITFTNSGASGNLIQLIGDTKCQQFIDMSMGEIIIDGSDSATQTPFARSYGFNLTSGSYRYIKNITVKNAKINAFVLNSYDTIENCKTDGYCGTGITTTANYNTIKKCYINASERAIYVGNAGNTKVYDSILKSTQYDGIYLGGSNNNYFYSCYIETNINISGGPTWFYGCTIKSVNGNSVSTNTGLITLNAVTSTVRCYGCYFIGPVNQAISISTGSYAAYVHLYSCKFKNCQYSALPLSGLLYQYVYDCEYENCLTAVAYGTNTTLDDSYFNKCHTGLAGGNGTINRNRFANIANAITSSFTGTNSAPVYGEATEPYAGYYVTDQSPLGETKSLRFKGKYNAPVFVSMIPCKAGQAVTVRLKAKRSNTGASTLPYFVLGDQTVTMADNTNTQDITITYTHYKTEYVPLLICPVFGTSVVETLTVDNIEVA